MVIISASGYGAKEPSLGIGLPYEVQMGLKMLLLVQGLLMSCILVTLNDDVSVSAPIEPRGQASETIRDTDLLMKSKCV